MKYFKVWLLNGVSYLKYELVHKVRAKATLPDSLRIKKYAFKINHQLLLTCHSLLLPKAELRVCLSSNLIQKRLLQSKSGSSCPKAIGWQRITISIKSRRPFVCHDVSYIKRQKRKVSKCARPMRTFKNSKFDERTVQHEVSVLKP